VATFQVSRGNETYEITAPDEATAMKAVQAHFGVGGADEGPSAAQAVGRMGAKAAAGGLGVGPAVGAVADAPTGAGGYMAGLGLIRDLITGKATPQTEAPVSGQVEQIQEKAASAVGPKPTTPEGRIIEAAGTAAIEALGGSGLFKVAGKIFTSYPEAKAAFDALAAGPVAQAGYSAAAAGGGQAAQEAGLPPIVGTVAGLAGAAGVHAAGAGIRAAPGAARAAIDEALVRTVPAQERRAAADLRAASADPAALEHNLMFGPSPELVPGSKPTLYEATDDIGIGAAQRRAATDDTGGYRSAIEERRAEQNKARFDEINALGGEGRKQAILDEFRRQRDELDQAHDYRERAYQSRADVAAGQAGTTATAEDVGRSIRDPMEASRREAKTAAGGLYDAIAAEGVTVGTGRLKAAVGKEFASSLEKPLSADEKYFADLIRGYSSRLDFNRLQDLRSEVVARGRQFSLPDNTRRRFRELKVAIDQAMDDGLARAVKDDPSLLQRAAAAAGSHGGDDLAARARAASGGLPAGTVAPEAGTARPAVGGFRDDAGSTGVPPREGVAAPEPRLSEAPAAPAATPNVEPAQAVDAALTQQQRAANAAWRQYKQRYGAEPVLKQGPNAGFAMTEAKIPEASFKAGNAGGERIRAMRAAGATDAALAEAAALSLQQKAIRDGVVDPTAFRRWLNNHASAIAELPPGVRRGFQSAADAAATLERVTAERQAALRGFDQSTVGKVLGVPVADLEKTIKSYLETPSRAHEMANAVSGNKAAQEGLRRLTADFIVRQFTSASDDLSKAALTTWLKRNRPGMAAVFGNEGALRFQRLSDDIERSRKQLVTGKDPAGPGTAGDLASVAKSAAGATVMSLIAKALGPKGIAAAGIGKAILGNMKLAGMADVDALFARALLDPELARKLLTKAPAVKNQKFLKGLGATILRSSLLGAAYGGT
jgi:hypothetical protein